MEAIARTPEPEEIILDLSDVRFAHATGMAPLVATVELLVSNGWRVLVDPPTDAFLTEYFESAGWIAGFQGVDPPQPRAGRTYVPLTPYRDQHELNSIVNAIVDQLASTTVLEPGVLDGVAWSLQEVTDNVLQHAGDGTKGWVQMTQQPKKGFVELVVADSGQGVTSSLRQAFPDLKDDREAVMKAIEQGSLVTRVWVRASVSPGLYE